MTLAWKLARRELRGGLRSLRVFIACLILGVAAIAGIGSVTSAIEAGLRDNGRALLGGDVELRLTHRFASPEERAWLDANTAEVSEIVDFRSMVVSPDGQRGLAQVKGVDSPYPLVGEIVLRDGALAGSLTDGGALAEPALLDRLGIAVGDTLRIGNREITLRGVIEEEPDRQIGGLQLGPRLMVARDTLDGSGLLQPGSLYHSSYRLTLPEGASISGFKDRLQAAFPDAGWRVRDASNGAPGAARFVERIGAFLILVGLASLAVGGVGVSAATRTYLDGKTETIATLKTLGAESGLIMRVYLLQIAAVAAGAVIIGALIGAVVPLIFADTLAASLPVPTNFGLYPAALGEAMLYGILTAMLFALWPLARAQQTRAAGLFRDIVEERRTLPRPVWIAVTALLALVLCGAAIWFSGSLFIGGGFVAGVVLALIALWTLATAIRFVAARLARNTKLTRGRTALRLSLASIGGPGGEVRGVVLSLGMGLTLLAAIGQIDSNLRGLVGQQLPQSAPAFFFIDIPAYERDDFVAAAEADSAIDRIETAPMLRGRITHFNGARVTADSIDSEASWMLRGDRGLTYARTPPEGGEIVEGAWWDPGHIGEPQVSFIEEEGRQLGLKISDTITVNVLGRDLTARIANFRTVEWQRMGINFVMIFNEAALIGAPHSHIATVYAPEEAEGRITRELGNMFPSAVAIPVRDAIKRTETLLGDLANGVRGASAVTLLTGLIVLIGATAAGQRARLYDAAILKTLGATRGGLLRAFALRYGLLGGAAAVLALGAGTLAAWVVSRFVLDAEFSFDPVSAAVILGGGLLATLGTGAAFGWRALSVKPAQALRSRE